MHSFRNRLASAAVLLGACRSPAASRSVAPVAPVTPVTPVTRATPVAPVTARAAASVGSGTAGAHAPRTVPLVEDHFGIEVADPYRWMEKPDGDELDAWMRSEGERTRTMLDAIPGRARLLARVSELGLDEALVSDVRSVGDSRFYFKTERGSDLRKLVVRVKGGPERVLVDPAAVPVGPREPHASIEHFAPSPDGRLVAYGIARGGGEIATEHVLDTATGRDLPDALQHIWGEFGVSWLPDGKAFFYTQMAREGFEDGSIDKLLKMRARLHRVGEGADRDTPVTGYGMNPRVPFDPQEFPTIVAVPGSPWALTVAAGARAEKRILVARLADVVHGAATWTAVCDYSDGVEDFVLHGDELFVVSNKGAPNKRVLRVLLPSARLERATVVVPEGDGVVGAIAGAKDGLYVTVERDGRGSLRRVPFGSATVERLALPFEGSIDELTTDTERRGVVVRAEGWTRKDAFFSYDPASRSFADLALVPSSNADFSSIAVEEVHATAPDGVEIPLTVLRRKDLALDGARPTIVTGYGAYGASMTASYRPPLLAWLERGGVWAVAHVRGGGERGDAWRRAGWRDTKPNTWRDFEACAEWLVAHRYTSSARLAATGASMGGILVGRAMTDRPDLFAAAAIYAGEVNTTRYLVGSNGANQSAELGTPDTPEGFRSLLAMDAYQSVRANVAYPAVLLGTGLNDARVSPWQSAKLAARLRASTSSGRSISLRVEQDEGHGVGSTRRQRLTLLADTWSFFLAAMGDPEPAAPPPVGR